MWALRAVVAIVWFAVTVSNEINIDRPEKWSNVLNLAIQFENHDTLSLGISGPTFPPTMVPTVSFAPTEQPIESPTETPSVVPSVVPTYEPTFIPTFMPSQQPTFVPSAVPSVQPTVAPTRRPSRQPTRTPTKSPNAPTASPSSQQLPVVSFDTKSEMQFPSPNLSPSDKQAIEIGTASTLNVPSSSVYFVSANSARRRVLRQVEEQVDLTAVTLLVITNVQLSLVNFPQFGTNTSSLVNFVSHTLQQAVLDGNFTANLQEAAISLGLNSSSNAFSVVVTSSGVDNVEVGQPVEDDDDSGFSSRMIILAAGVVIAGIIFIAFLAAGLSLLSGYIIDQDMKKKMEEKEAAKAGTSIIVQDQDFHEVYPDSNGSQHEKRMISMPREISGRI